MLSTDSLFFNYTKLKLINEKNTVHVTEKYLKFNPRSADGPQG